MRDRSLHGETETTEEAPVEGEETEPIETHAVSAELDESVEAGEVEPSDDMTAEGYDEAVESGVPFTAEQEILAWESADPVSVTEAEPIPVDEIVLQEPGRDLRPDTITPSPDITSTGVAALYNMNQLADEISVDELATSQETASAESTAEAETSTPATSEDAASGGSSDEEKQ